MPDRQSRIAPAANCLFSQTPQLHKVCIRSISPYCPAKHCFSTSAAASVVAAMAMPCPSSQTPQDFTCGVQRCCDTISCDINVQGPCVCASYGEASPSQAGWNYSFMANCAQNSVTGTSLGTECRTLLGVPYAYSCYCRPREAGDVGNIGDQVPGNAIFDYNDQCVLFKSAVPTVNTGQSSTSGGVSVSPPLLITFGLLLILRLVIPASR